MLDLALNFDSNAHGDEIVFREDVKVMMAHSGLYDWLMKIVSVSGIIAEDGEYGADAAHQDIKRDKDKEDKEKKNLNGMCTFAIMQQIFHSMTSD